MTRAGGWRKMDAKSRKEFPMNDMLLVHALLFNRSSDWTIERAVPVYASRPAPVSVRQIFLACL